VALVMGDRMTVLYDGTPTLDAGQRLVVAAVDQPPPPGLAEGAAVFEDRGLGGCDVCHTTAGGRNGVGPSLSGVADRAETRVPGLTAEEYLRQSILDPDAYVVDGFPAGQMLPMYGERLSQGQIDALVEYLLSLRTEAGAGGAP
jgi:mono/diheme cytochrome c family protein